MVTFAILTPFLLIIVLGVVVVLGLACFYLKMKKLKTDETQTVNEERYTLPRYYSAMHTVVCILKVVSF